MLSQFAGVVQAASKPQLQPGDVKTWHFVGWFQGLTKNGNNHVVYLYTKYGDYYACPVYKNQDGSWPELPFQVPTKIDGAQPPMRQIGFQMNLVHPCDFFGQVEFYGQPNEKGRLRRRYKGIDQSNGKSSIPQAVLQAPVPKGNDMLSGLITRMANQTGIVGVNALVQEATDLYKEQILSMDQLNEFFQKHFMPKKAQLEGTPIETEISDEPF
jgi:hypothetical protein